MITGYLKPDAGRIRFDGRDITALAPRAITRLGVARSFQIPQLCGDLTVLDNMLVAGACHDQRLSFWQPRAARRGDRRAPSGCWSASASAEHRDRRVAELPGGVRKLLDIAMALTGAPKLLLLDEPTSGVSRRREVPDDGHHHGGARRRGDDRALRRARHGHRRALRRPRDRLLQRPHHRRRRARRRRSATDDVRRYVTGELLAE